MPAADRVGEQLAPELAVLAAAEPRGGALGELDVEHVQVAAATAEPDHLPVERADQIDVIGLQIPEHQRQDAEPGQRQRHPPDAARLAEPLQAHHERRRGREQAGALKPADRIPAHRRTRQQVLSERRADQRRAGADRERPQPTRLHARAAPLRRRLQVHAATSARPVPPARTGQQRPLPHPLPLLRRNRLIAPGGSARGPSGAPGGTPRPATPRRTPSPASPTPAASQPWPSARGSRAPPWRAAAAPHPAPSS